ncbi:MAG: hypothetical protein ACR2H0_04220 [Candidatus Limnocylindrales bacterium]
MITPQPGLLARPTPPMKHGAVRLVAGSAAVCLATWLALLTAGNTGLQRSITKGALTLFEQPLTVALVAAAGFGIAYVMATRLRLGALPILLGVLLGDAFAGLILAPVAIGELEPIHAPLVFAAVTVLGVQPAAALIGAVAARQRSRDIGRR